MRDLELMNELLEKMIKDSDGSAPAVQRPGMNESNAQRTCHAEPLREAGLAQRKPYAGNHMTGTGHDFLAATNAGRLFDFPKFGRPLDEEMDTAGPAGAANDSCNGIP